MRHLSSTQADVLRGLRPLLAALVLAGTSSLGACSPAGIGGVPSVTPAGINRAVAHCHPDMAVGVHLCRGNFKGHFLAAGSYQAIAERFFGEVKVTHFLLEYDTPRAGDFAPLRFVPKRKGVVLGLISTKSPALETVDALQRRIGEAARHIDLERLAIGPQCGFASTVAGNPLTEADQRAKLKRAVEFASQVWGSP